MDIYKGLMDIIPKKYLKEDKGITFLSNPLLDFYRMDGLDILSNLDEEDYNRLFKVCEDLGLIWRGSDCVPVENIAHMLKHYINTNLLNGLLLFYTFKQRLKEYFTIIEKLCNNEGFVNYNDNLRYNMFSNC